jgi:hypothetical protein
MNERVLQHMYQSWMQGNDTYVHDWIQFAEMVSRHFDISIEEAIKALNDYYWFKKGEQ